MARSSALALLVNDFCSVFSMYSITLLILMRLVGYQWVTDSCMLACMCTLLLHVVYVMWQVVMKELLAHGLIHGDCLTVSGCTVAENLATVPSLSDLGTQVSNWCLEPTCISCMYVVYACRMSCILWISHFHLLGDTFWYWKYGVLCCLFAGVHTVGGLDWVWLGQSGVRKCSPEAQWQAVWQSLCWSSKTVIKCYCLVNVRWDLSV